MVVFTYIAPLSLSLQGGSDQKMPVIVSRVAPGTPVRSVFGLRMRDIIRDLISDWCLTPN